MNQALKDYHSQRRPFIIIPDTGIILGELGQSYAHREILSKIGLTSQQISYILDNYPRGYYLNNKLVIYQSDNVNEGECWRLKPENYTYVRRYFEDLKNLFHLNNNSKIFLAILRGKEGDIWPTIDEVPINFFEE